MSRIISLGIFVLSTVTFVSCGEPKVKVGDALPDAVLHEDTPQTPLRIADEINNKKVIIIGLPGAFTPNCSTIQVPNFLQRHAELKKKGVDEIFVVSVNDAFVMEAWQKDQKAVGKIRFLADPNLEFTKKLGVEQEMAALGGWRSKRFVMLVDNGKISQFNVEPDGVSLSCSLVDDLKL